jgi:hypothetical protein
MISVMVTAAAAAEERPHGNVQQQQLSACLS